MFLYYQSIVIVGDIKMRPRRGRRPWFSRGRGLQNGDQTGLKNGGMGRNRTDDCRHPEIKKKRES